MNKNNFKKIFKKILLPSAIALAFIFSLGFSHLVHSSTLDNVSGYAWGSDDWNLAYDANANGVQDAGEAMPDINGTGWLSFNCSTGGTCGNSNYGINIDSAGNINGYAWSSNYGWMKFGGFSVSDFPSGIFILLSPPPL